ncbi:uncharacterized protein LOC131952689 [Physella acuta]|uniref:uncharacterized protein LOC131952689 n=1 Tax=Physella acuta TaxID=109671 RepID=UPI0027DCE2B9|nr:uncharacterized protein LOC131952689 [Physella acuta]XP_059171446.1 uncharacterized protein LOC131952689 [Physella acuta]
MASSSVIKENLDMDDKGTLAGGDQEREISDHLNGLNGTRDGRVLFGHSHLRFDPASQTGDQTQRMGNERRSTADVRHTCSIKPEITVQYIKRRTCSTWLILLASCSLFVCGIIIYVILYSLLKKFEEIGKQMELVNKLASSWTISFLSYAMGINLLSGLFGVAAVIHNTKDEYKVGLFYSGLALFINCILIVAGGVMTYGSFLAETMFNPQCAVDMVQVEVGSICERIEETKTLIHGIYWSTVATAFVQLTQFLYSAYDYFRPNVPNRLVRIQHIYIYEYPS